MESLRVRAKKWGNSFGIIIPKKIVESKKIKEGTEISLTVEPINTMTAGDLMELSRKMGISKKLKKIDTQKALEEMDKELWPENE